MNLAELVKITEGEQALGDHNDDSSGSTEVRGRKLRLADAPQLPYMVSS